MLVERGLTAILRNIKIYCDQQISSRVPYPNEALRKKLTIFLDDYPVSLPELLSTSLGNKLVALHEVQCSQ